MKNHTRLTQAVDWFKNSIADKHIFGKKTELSNGVRHINTKEDLRIYKTNWRNSNNPYFKKERLVYPKEASNTDYRLHFDGKHVLYYANKSCTNELLIMIDIDINKKKGEGTLSGAKKFERHLKKVLGKNLYFERSTSGKSRHGYIFIDTQSNHHEKCIYALKLFQNWLRLQAKETKAQIEFVEVKGHPGKAYYKGNTCTEVKFGQLAKVPYALKSPRLTTLLLNTVSIKLKDIIGGSYGARVLDEDIQLQSGSNGNMSNNIPPFVSKGSFESHYFRPEDLAKIVIYSEVASQLFGNECTVPTGMNCKNPRKRKVTPDHFAIAIMIMEKFSRTPEIQNTSTYRFQKVWQSLFDHGSIKIRFEKSIFLFIKNKLNDRGFIKWIDINYNFSLHFKVLPKSTVWFLDNYFVFICNNLTLFKNNSLENIFGPNIPQKSVLKITRIDPNS